MITARVDYQGNLRTQALHVKSGETIITDAPTDNNGNGEAFSPTDLLSTSLLCCMFTVMGIAARKKEIKFDAASAELTKIMADSPRRVQRIIIRIKINENWNERERKIMENTAINCPVALSLSKEIDQDIQFEYLSS